MNLLFYSTADDPSRWREALTRLLPDLKVYPWPEVKDKDQIDAALVWKPPPGLLAQFPNLKLIASLGMGIDHILQDPALPPHVPIVRLIDDNIIAQIGEYVCHGVLHHHRRIDDYERLQRERRWQPLPPPDTSQRRTGILGLGAIGSHCARLLVGLGFPVSGWSQSRKSISGVISYCGNGELTPLLQSSDVLICLLPLTRATENIINAANLAKLPQNAYFINCARGAHVVDEALLTALDTGHLAGAALDVFRQEPLPPEHPFWHHPRIRLTPHIAGITVAQAGAPQVADNLRRLQTGQPLVNEVDRSKEY